MKKEDLYYRPPSESESFIIRVMHGCSYSQCDFCNMFKDIKLEYLSLDEIFKGIEDDAEDISDKFIHHIKSVYLEGGDPLSIATDDLIKIIEHAKKHFPQLKRIVCYATARSIVKKRPSKLLKLRNAGLNRVFLGLESGSNAVLKNINKGCNKADLISAGLYLNHAGIANDVSIMLGIGSYDLSNEHAIQTAEVINKTKPVCIRIRTFTPNSKTKMAEDYLNGNFKLMSPHAILRELKNFVELIDCEIQILSDHWLNFLRFDLYLPKQKAELLKAIDEALKCPESKFRELGIIDRRNEVEIPRR